MHVPHAAEARGQPRSLPATRDPVTRTSAIAERAAQGSWPWLWVGSYEQDEEEQGTNGPGPRWARQDRCVISHGSQASTASCLARSTC
jgi:hypothetical protein